MPRDDITTILSGIGARGARTTGRANWGNFHRPVSGLSAGQQFARVPRMSAPAPDYSGYLGGDSAYGFGPGKILYTPPPAAARAPAAVAPAPVAGISGPRSYIDSVIDQTGANDWQRADLMRAYGLPFWGTDVGDPGGNPGAGLGVADNASPSDFARGGAIDGADVHGAAFERGLVETPTGGRQDAHTITIRVNSYVLPADIVSSIGDGNTLAGAKRLDQLERQNPMPPVAGLARGGLAGGRTRQIRISGGEYVLSPERVAALGGGDYRRGAVTLDREVEAIRGHQAKKLKSLPGPIR